MSGEFSEQAVLLPAAASAKAERERFEKQYIIPRCSKYYIIAVNLQLPFHYDKLRKVIT